MCSDLFQYNPPSNDFLYFTFISCSISSIKFPVVNIAASVSLTIKIHRTQMYSTVHAFTYGTICSRVYSTMWQSTMQLIKMQQSKKCLAKNNPY